VDLERPQGQGDGIELRIVEHMDHFTGSADRVSVYGPFRV